MARPLRLQYPGAFYHITSRGNEGRAIFKTNRDREKFLSYLESAHERYGAIIHVYCLMENHYHLLLETPRGNLAQILHHINGAYTTYFNIKRRRSGHLFQGRYRAILVEKDSYGEELSRYIHLNPVRAGLVETPAQYPWASYPFYIGLKEKPSWVTTEFILGYFGKDGVSARESYRRFVEDGLKKEPKNPLKEVFASTFLGGSEFIRRAKEKLVDIRDGDARNIPALRDLITRPSLEQIERAIESVIRRDHPLYKRFCIYVSHRRSGFSLKEIGVYYGMEESAISQSSRRFRQRILEDRRVGKLLAEIISALSSVKC